VQRDRRDDDDEEEKMDWFSDEQTSQLCRPVSRSAVDELLILCEGVYDMIS